jgi:hypothetical protein
MALILKRGKSELFLSKNDRLKLRKIKAITNIPSFLESVL